MNKPLLILFFICAQWGLAQSSGKIIARQGQVTFFSYTSVENIDATNNQVLSIIDLNSKEIAISMLMRAFVFKKALMQEHFNESYVESDIFPKATFEGEIPDLDISFASPQTRMVKGSITVHGITRPIEVKTNFEKKDNKLQVSGDFEVKVQDFEIKVPPIVAANIAKTISVTFNFEYQSYEE